MTKEEFFALGGTQENLSDLNFNAIEFVESLEGINDLLIREEIERRRSYFETDKCFLTEKYVWSLTPEDEDYYRTFCFLTNGQGNRISKYFIDYYLSINNPLRDHRKVQLWLDETYHFITCAILNQSWIQNHNVINEGAKNRLLESAIREDAKVPPKVMCDTELQKKITLDYYKKIIDLWCDHSHPRPVEKQLDNLTYCGFKMSIYDAYDYLYDEWKKSTQKNNKMNKKR
jgi:hypothetical protein